MKVVANIMGILTVLVGLGLLFKVISLPSIEIVGIAYIGWGLGLIGREW